MGTREARATGKDRPFERGAAQKTRRLTATENSAAEN